MSSSGKWKPDPEKEECGQDLNLSFLYCDDDDGCLAKRNEFPYMVCYLCLRQLYNLITYILKIRGKARLYCQSCFNLIINRPY